MMPSSRRITSPSRQAFTLIEMSVVLVIIGLIVGGIMVGREIVHASEINSILADATRIRTAMMTFQLKYKALPGDMPNATSYWGAATGCPDGTNGTCNGNGDSNIDTGTWWTSNSEFYRFWQHLSLSGMMPGNYTGVTNSTSAASSAVIIGTNMMPNKMNGMFGAYSASDTFHLQTNVIGTWGSDPTQMSFSPADAKTLDSKADDGRPGTGVVTTNVASTAGSCVDVVMPSSAKYLVSNSLVACNIIFWPN